MNFKKTVAIAAAAGALTALAIPAMAEITPFVSVRLLTGYQTTDKAVGDSTTDLFFKMPNTTRFGVKMSEGAYGGTIEFGINELTGNIYNRLAFGTYKMDAGTLLVGQDYTKSWNPSAAISEDRPNNGGWGNFYAGRIPQIRFQMDNGLYVAAIQPFADTSSTNSETMIPKLNLGYDGKAGPAGYGLGAEFQTYRNVTIDEQITSYLVYARANFASGPFALKANLGYGQNLGNAGFTGASAVYTGSTKKLDSTTRIEGYVQAGFTVSPMLKIQAIVGGAQDDNDTWAKADSQMSVAVNAPITISKNFSITPEIAMMDKMKDKNGNKENKDYYYGAKWQFDF